MGRRIDNNMTTDILFWARKLASYSPSGPKRLLASSPLVRRSLLATTQLPASEACYLQLLDPESCWLPFPGPPGLLASCKPCWHAEGLLGQAALGHSLPADAQAETVPWSSLPLNIP